MPLKKFEGIFGLKNLVNLKSKHSIFRKIYLFSKNQKRLLSYGKPFLAKNSGTFATLMFSQRKFLIVNCFQIMYHKFNYPSYAEPSARLIL